MHRQKTILNRLYSILVFFAVTLTASVGFNPFLSQAQQSFTTGGAGGMSSADKVGTETKFSLEQVPQGEEFRIALLMDIEDGWHINAHEPTLRYLIGTELTLRDNEDFTITDISYPEPKEYEFAFAGGEALLVYEGTSPIFLTVQASEDAEPGRHLLEGDLTVQACDDETCLAPTDINIRFDFEVAEAGTEVTGINQDLFSDYDPSAGPALGELRSIEGEGNVNQIASIIEDRGLILAFGAIFLIGLALNLTPCVYPMLSVTVSIFGAQTDQRTGVIFSKALTYVLGIATMYSVLGVAAAFTGGLFGAWLQSPIVLATIGILFFLLALSMFGLYELQPPYWLTSKLGAGQSTGFIGTYFSGLVVGVFAAPCIGPPIIALLTFVGTQGDPMFGFMSFFVLSLGLGLPYLILGTFTGLMQNLPKSGEWMNWVKKVFGIVLIALAVFYVGLAFFPQYNLHILAATLILGGIYLGFIERTGSEKKVFPWVKRAVGTAGVVVGALFIMNLQQEGIQWEDYAEDKVDQAREEGRTVVMDFYADWCIPCLELERVTFTDNQVIDATEEMVRLKVDLTNFESPEAEELRRRYEIAGVPTIVFLGPDGEEVEEARVVGFLNPKQFLQRIEKVNSQYAELQD